MNLPRNLKASVSKPKQFLLKEIPHSRFNQIPSLKKLLQQRFGYFSIPNDKKNSWGNFEGMFPQFFLRYWPKRGKYGLKQPNLLLLP